MLSRLVFTAAKGRLVPWEPKPVPGDGPVSLGGDETPKPAANSGQGPAPAPPAAGSAPPGIWGFILPLNPLGTSGNERNYLKSPRVLEGPRPPTLRPSRPAGLLQGPAPGPARP